jgi:hypothetical protein
MVRRFINASKIEIYKKILPPQRTAVGPYIPLWPAALPEGHAAAGR